MLIIRHAPGIRRGFVMTALAIVPLGLAGCHNEKSVEAKDATPQAVASKVAASGIRPRPGRWEATMQMEKMDFPGMTPQMRDAMQANMGRKTTFASCLTKAEADKPEASFFQSKDNRCKFNNFTMSDGKIDATLTCDEAEGRHTMTMSGTYTPTSYKIHMDMNGKSHGQAMSMSMTTAASRVGECRGDENS